jgi:NTP pyrophosphatase (non-canonical NTP hydrolase)
MELGEFQELIEKTYFARDSKRGVAGTFMWFVEEVGELASAIRRGTPEDKKEECADVLAWLVSIASLAGVEMEEAVLKYAHGCPVCKKMPCACPEKP